MNIVEKTLSEISRVKELLPVYESISTGVFGATVLRLTIENAEKAMINNDLVEMLKYYSKLKNCS